MEEMKKELEKAFEKAHQDYEERKERILLELHMLLNDTDNQLYKKVLEEAIEFIKEKEI